MIWPFVRKKARLTDPDTLLLWLQASKPTDLPTWLKMTKDEQEVCAKIGLLHQRARALDIAQALVHPEGFAQSFLEDTDADPDAEPDDEELALEAANTLRHRMSGGSWAGVGERAQDHADAASKRNGFTFLGTPSKPSEP